MATCIKEEYIVLDVYEKTYFSELLVKLQA